MDKAGSYGIQGIGGCLISGIRGCYYNVRVVALMDCQVMGFPLYRFCKELKDMLLVVSYTLVYSVYLSSI